jgi:hypothetical protein
VLRCCCGPLTYTSWYFLFGWCPSGFGTCGLGWVVFFVIALFFLVARPVGGEDVCLNLWGEGQFTLFLFRVCGLGAGDSWACVVFGVGREGKQTTTHCLPPAYRRRWLLVWEYVVNGEQSPFYWGLFIWNGEVSVVCVCLPLYICPGYSLCTGCLILLGFSSLV